MRKNVNKIIIGVDEVGRGPLAGPVVACAFTICSKNNFQLRSLASASSLSFGDFSASRNHAKSPAKYAENLFFSQNIRDSKKLSEKQREEIYQAIKNCPDFVWAIGQVSEKMIDKINILQATKLAMQKAVASLNSKLQIPNHKQILLIDGNMRFDDGWFGDGVKYESIIKGDEKIFEISTASIIAKVYRDNLMEKMAKKYPQYGFEKHKGYGTKLHYEKLTKHGQCPIHRKTFISSKK